LAKTFDDASDFDEQPQDPFNLKAERALSRQHQQQRFVASALWELPIGDEENRSGPKAKEASWPIRMFSNIELAPIVTIESGRPVNPLTGLDSRRNQALPLSSRPQGFGRNSLTTPTVANIDLRILKYFPFGESRRLDLVAEAFNLLNHTNVTQINPTYGIAAVPQAGFGQPIAAAAARKIQFSLDFEF